jgi:hypothetical protein
MRVVDFPPGNPPPDHNPRSEEQTLRQAFYAAWERTPERRQTRVKGGAR